MRFELGLSSVEPVQGAIECSKLAEETGYDVFSLQDETFHTDVYSSLAVSAHITNSIKLATCVTNPYTRHPVVTAAAIATINAISGGRAQLGFARGGNSIDGLGLAGARPLRLLRDSILVMRRLLAGERIEERLETLHLAGVQLHPHTGALPILLAARGPKTLALAGEIADGVIMGWCTERAIEYALERVRVGAARKARTIDSLELVSSGPISLNEDEDKARAAARSQTAALVTKNKELLPLVGMKEDEVELATKEFSESAGSGGSAKWEYVTDEMIDTFSFVGTPERLVARVKRLSSKGVNRVRIVGGPSVSGQGLKDLIKDFARDVIAEID